MVYREEKILSIEIKKSNEMGLFIDILDNDYNIIRKTIYNQNIAQQIIDIIKKEIK